MPSDYNRDLADQDVESRRSSQAAPADPVYDTGDDAAVSLPAASAVLAHPDVAGRGNAPVRAAALQRMQQAHGNRAVQRFLQRQAAAEAPVAEDDDIGARIQAKAGGGSSLEPGVQRQLESGLGADLSGVRVHTDGEADQLSRSVDAVAFTTGSDIFFRNGAYDPSSTAGMHLLAHEATHTVQQAAGPVAGTPSAGGVSVSDPGDSYEQAAERSAAAVTSGTPAVAAGGASAGGSAVQREAAPPDEEELPAQTMRASTWAVQREAAPPDEEELPAQTMRAGTWVQREAAPPDEEELPAQTMRASTWVQRAAPGQMEEEQVPPAQAAGPAPEEETAEA